MKQLTKLAEKRLLKNVVEASQYLHDENPHRKGNMFNTLRKVKPSHLLDASLLDVLTESANGSEDPSAHLLGPRDATSNKDDVGQKQFTIQNMHHALESK